MIMRERLDLIPDIYMLGSSNRECSVLHTKELHGLFRKYSKAVAESLRVKYPDYDEAITKYTQQIYDTLNK